MNKKAFIYANIDCSEKSYVKKIENVSNLFDKSGFKTKLLLKKNSNKNYCTYKNVKFVKNTILSYFEFLIQILLTKFDLIYIRHPRLNFAYIFILACTKILHKKCFIIHEIPTYPYDLEWNNKSLFEILLKTMDKISRLYLKYFIDLIVFIGGYKKKKIFGVRAIEIDNGVNIDDYQPYKKLKSSKNVNIVGVGNISLRHGYDRIIKAISKLKDTKYNVNFYIVGTGSELNNLKILSKKLNIYNSQIFFYGRKSGSQLDNIFYKSHVAVGNLGFHRIKVQNSNALKEREFMARGIPYIAVTIDQRIDMNKACVFQVAGSENEINLNLIIKKLKKKYLNKRFQYMRDFAKANLNWENTLSPLLKEVKKIVKNDHL